MEIWHTIPKFPTYEINESLDVRHKRYKKVKRFYLDEGYLRTNIHVGGKKYNAPLHRLVAFTFVPNPDPVNKTDIHHIDEDPLNNRPSNLQWVTKSEHRQISVKNGQQSFKLTESDVVFIRDNYWLLGKKVLADMFKVTVPTICSIAAGRARKHIVSPVKHFDLRPFGGHKPIIDLQTGIFYTSDELSFVLGMKRRYIHRMLNEDRKPNTTQYRYA